VEGPRFIPRSYRIVRCCGSMASSSDGRDQLHFRRMPRSRVLEKWGRSVPRFPVRAQGAEAITHHAIPDVGELLSKFLAVAAALRDRLGAVLFQLPPDFRKDAAWLRDVWRCCRHVPGGVSEFRSVVVDDEVFGLRARAGPRCAGPKADGGLDVPVVATAAWVMCGCGGPLRSPRVVGVAAAAAGPGLAGRVRVLPARGRGHGPRWEGTPGLLAAVGTGVTGRGRTALRRRPVLATRRATGRSSASGRSGIR